MIAFELNTLMGSNQRGHRQAIRSALYKRIPDPSLLDLTKPARKLEQRRKGLSKVHYASIAHCRTLGGFALSPRLVGLDIEESARVTPLIANRIRRKEEDNNVPPAVFWTAKEAAFKSLRDSQPKTTSDIVISEWRKLRQDHFGFSTNEGAGHVWIFGPWTIAVFQPVSN